MRRNRGQSPIPPINNQGLAGVRRVELVTSGGRFEDVPFDAAAGEVLMLPAPAELKRFRAYAELNSASDPNLR